jgi:hypothetical protein
MASKIRGIMKRYTLILLILALVPSISFAQGGIDLMWKAFCEPDTRRGNTG